MLDEPYPVSPCVSHTPEESETKAWGGKWQANNRKVPQQSPQKNKAAEKCLDQRDSSPEALWGKVALSSKIQEQGNDSMKENVGQE